MTPDTDSEQPASEPAPEPAPEQSASGLHIVRIAAASEMEPHLASLRKLLQRCVNEDPGSSSVGFLAPLSDQAAIGYWLSLSLASSTERRHPATVLLVATHREVPGVLATAQIGLESRETHAHRGEVRKLLVHPTYRRHGFGRLMMAEVERVARQDLGLDLLVLDTARESSAREFFCKVGWSEWGMCPEYARSADGRKHATCFFLKRLRG